MDMKHIFKAIITLAASAAVLVSCTKGFEDINKDRFGVTDEQMAQDGLALGGMYSPPVGFRVVTVGIGRVIFLHDRLKVVRT